MIKQFDFDELDCIKIIEIKQKLQISSLQLNTAKDRDGNPTNYYRHWDYENRYAVVIKKSLVDKIKENNDLQLTIEKTIKKANLGYYTNFEITEYTEEEYRDCDLREVYEEYYDRSNWLMDAAGTDDPEVMNDVYWNLD